MLRLISTFIPPYPWPEKAIMRIPQLKMQVIYRQVNVSEKAEELTSEVGRAPPRTGQDGLAIS